MVRPAQPERLTRNLTVATVPMSRTNCGHIVPGAHTGVSSSTARVVYVPAHHLPPSRPGASSIWIGAFLVIAGTGSDRAPMQSTAPGPVKLSV